MLQSGRHDHRGTGTRSVIIRTKPGEREEMSKSLVAQGRRVTGEFPSLDAIAAEAVREGILRKSFLRGGNLID